MKKIVIGSMVLMVLGAMTLTVKAAEAAAGSCASSKAAPATAAAPAKNGYPLDTCVISGEKLGDMGEQVIIQHEGREVRFCCKKCVKKFNQDPAKYLKILDDAEKARAAATSK